MTKKCYVIDKTLPENLQELVCRSFQSSATRLFFKDKIYYYSLIWGMEINLGGSAKETGVLGL